MNGLEHVVTALGGDDFAATLLASLNILTPVDHCALIRFEPNQGARLLASASRAGLAMADAVQQDYLREFQQIDPNRRLFGPAASGHVQTSRLPREQVPNLRYRSRCYDGPGLVDRFSVVAGTPDAWYCLNLFRSSAHGAFLPGDGQALHQRASLLAALAIKHAGLCHCAAPANRLQRMAELELRLQVRHPGLTPRERQVLVRIVTGLASGGIALDLGLKLNSVLTYRKRAYARLGISSQNQLFALYL